MCIEIKFAFIRLFKLLRYAFIKISLTVSNHLGILTDYNFLVHSSTKSVISPISSIVNTVGPIVLIFVDVTDTEPNFQIAW